MSENRLPFSPAPRRGAATLTKNIEPIEADPSLEIRVAVETLPVLTAAFLGDQKQMPARIVGEPAAQVKGKRGCALRIVAPEGSAGCNLYKFEGELVAFADRQVARPVHVLQPQAGRKKSRCG